jgi:uncharacterized membrane protein YhhN
MRQDQQPLEVLFFFLSALHLSALAWPWPTLAFLTKPMLVGVLAIYYYLLTRRDPSRFNRSILLGLIFSIAGDTFLLFQSLGETYFLLGLGSFLLAQLSYLRGFLAFKPHLPGLLRRRPAAIIPLFIYLPALLAFLWPAVSGVLRGAIVVYGAAITAMACGSLHLLNKAPGKAGASIFAGALFFVLSDSLIALNKFRSDAFEIPQSGLLIMATYLIAQWLIVRGAIAAEKD